MFRYSLADNRAGIAVAVPKPATSLLLALGLAAARRRL